MSFFKFSTRWGVATHHNMSFFTLGTKTTPVFVFVAFHAPQDGQASTRHPSLTPRLDFRVAEGFSDHTTPPSLETRDGGFAEHEKTPMWCLFVLSVFPSRAEHKKTPALVFFCDRRLSTMTDVCQTTSVGVSSCWDACRTRKDTYPGVFSCSATFLHPQTHAEHKKTPMLVSFCARERGGFNPSPVLLHTFLRERGGSTPPQYLSFCNNEEEFPPRLFFCLLK